jgi:ribosomal protein S19E (S16A)
MAKRRKRRVRLGSNREQHTSEFDYWYKRARSHFDKVKYGGADVSCEFALDQIVVAERVAAVALVHLSSAGTGAKLEKTKSATRTLQYAIEDLRKKIQSKCLRSGNVGR